jgi:hypothetical protein
MLYINITEEYTHVLPESPPIIEVARNSLILQIYQNSYIYFYEIVTKSNSLIMFNTKNIPKYIPSSCKVLFKIFNDSTNKQINITRICSRLMIDLNIGITNDIKTILEMRNSTCF